VIGYLIFKSKNENIWIPFGAGTNTLSYRDGVKNTQLYKAFNHLRKLCGAPEPLTFD